MHDLYLIGAGGLALQLCGWFAAGWGQGLRLRGFIDSWGRTGILDRLGSTAADGRLLSLTCSGFEAGPDDRFVMAVADPLAKRTLLEQVCRSCGIVRNQFVTLVHPSAICSTDCNIDLGLGVVIGPFCIIEPHTLIGDFVTINMYASVGHDCEVGAFSTLSPRSAVLGGACVRHDCFLAAGATINVRCEVGEHAWVGMNASVISPVPPWTRVYGVPARVVEQLPRPDASAQGSAP